MALRCPGRETSVPELAVNGALLGLTAVYTGAACCIFVANRTNFPIAQRSPVLVVLCTIAVLCSIVILDVATMASRQFNCIGNYLALSIAFGVALLGYLIRFAFICLEYEIAKGLAAKVESGDSPLFLQKLLNLRAFLNSPLKLAFVFVVLIVGAMLLPLVVVAAKIDPGVLIYEDACTPLKRAFAYLTMTYFALFILGCLCLGYFLKRVQENFYIMTELKMLMYIAIYILVTLILGDNVPAITIASNCKFRFLMIVSQMIPTALTATASFVFPLYKMRAGEKNSTEVSSSGRSSVFRGRQDLVALLKDPVRCEHFRQFLVKEFASENLLFWTKVDNLPKLSGDRDALVAEIKRINQEFCEADSVCCINISYDSRVALSTRMKLLEQLVVEDLLTIFQEAKKEIEVLMLRDSFARFVLSKDYQATSSELELVSPRTLPIPVQS